MKPIQIAKRNGFTAYLVNGKANPKMEIVFTDNSKAPVTLGPDDYLPGCEPDRGIKASSLAWLFDEEKKKMKPEAIALAEKFSRSGEVFTKGEARTKYNLNSALECHLSELNQVCHVLDLIGSSEPVTSATDNYPAENKRLLEQLRASFDLIAEHIKENARKAFEIYSRNHFEITGKPVVPDCVKNDYIFRDE